MAAKRRLSRNEPAGGDEQTAQIPSFLVEYFLLGRTRRGAIEHFIQDGGISTDVWLAFASEPREPQRVLVAPASSTSSTAAGYALHHAIMAYRAKFARGRGTADVSPLETFVAMRIYFDELVRVLLPLTRWWRQKRLTALRGGRGSMLQEKLSDTIQHILGRGRPNAVRGGGRDLDASRIVEAAPLAALIGVFVIAKDRPSELDGLRTLDPHRKPEDRATVIAWIEAHADEIAHEWRDELDAGGKAWEVVEPDLPKDSGYDLLDRVFLDRAASLASEGNCTIKADAAKRVFDVSCRGITWAVIDSGIATTHPAFIDHYLRGRKPKEEPPRRIKATLDFTLIERIRNFNLTISGSAAQRDAVIRSLIDDLERLPGREPGDPAFRKMAREKLKAIAVQLEQRLPPDWNLIEPLIRITTPDDGAALPSDHGTHVAGILGADWRDDDGTVVLQGVCPDIDLYDLRVVHAESIEATEFALLAALEYVQFVNARAGSRGPLIHGVNISMSIPHKVRTYGCGATPVCVACDRLVGAGVVVVAAAGNRGWNEMEIGFGNFVSSSITDPGNAREVITVGSTHGAKPHIYGVSFFSSRGPTGDGRIKPDLVAPGERVRGPLRGDSDGELDGTSMAAPFVSGAAAMLISRHRELIGDPERVKQVLLETATDLGREKYFQGHGLVDVLRAMQAI
jgi:serine protease AprX